MKKAYSYTRFSTPEQLHGSSYNRQKQLAEKWASKNGYELVDHIEGFQLFDKGKSGFHAAHIHEGALGKFYELVNIGKIEKGSVLIVESLDRLSREGAMKFLPRFLDLVEAEIILVTLIGGERRYEKGKVKENDLIPMIVELARANDESVTKSYRSWDNHNIKRDAVRAGAKEGKHLVGDGNVPPWINILKNGKKGPWPCELDEGKAKIIRQMVDLYLSGRGETLISKELNAQGVPIWSRREKRKATKWTKERVWAILRNRQIAGEHQLYYFPHKDEAGEEKHCVTSLKIKDRVPDGLPIKNYFPAVIDEETFALLQREITRRSGRTGPKGNVESMFPHLARCAYCGDGMAYQNKGYRPLKSGKAKEPHRYLVCSWHKNGAVPACIGTHLRYPPIEAAFLKWCREVDLASITGRVDHRLQLGKWEKELSEVKAAVIQINEQIEGLERQARYLKNEEAAAKNAQEVDSSYACRKNLEDRRARIESDIADLESSDRTVADHLQALNDLNGRLEKAAAKDERVVLRLQFRGAIASAVSEIRVFHDGLHDLYADHSSQGIELVPCCQEELADLNLAGTIGDKAMIKETQRKYDIARKNYIRLNTGRENAAFLVILKNGSQRLFQWDDLAGEYKERLAFEADTERIIYDGTAIELNTDNISEEDLLEEIAFNKSL